MKVKRELIKVFIDIINLKGNLSFLLTTAFQRCFVYSLHQIINFLVT